MRYYIDFLLTYLIVTCTIYNDQLCVQHMCKHYDFDAQK